VKNVSVKLWFICLLALAFLSSCDKKVDNPVSRYGDALIGAHQSAQQTAETASLASIQEGIRLYFASNGRYPGSLSELEDLMGAPIDADRYEYNPQTGTVRAKNN